MGFAEPPTSASKMKKPNERNGRPPFKRMSSSRERKLSNQGSNIDCSALPSVNKTEAFNTYYSSQFLSTALPSGGLVDRIRQRNNERRQKYWRKQ